MTVQVLMKKVFKMIDGLSPTIMDNLDILDNKTWIIMDNIMRKYS